MAFFCSPKKCAKKSYFLKKNTCIRLNFICNWGQCQLPFCSFGYVLNKKMASSRALQLEATFLVYFSVHLLIFLEFLLFDSSGRCRRRVFPAQLLLLRAPREIPPAAPSRQNIQVVTCFKSTDYFCKLSLYGENGRVGLTLMLGTGQRKRKILDFFLTILVQC